MSAEVSPKALRSAAEVNEGAAAFWRRLGCGEPYLFHAKAAWDLRMGAALAEGTSNARAQ